MLSNHKLAQAIADCGFYEFKCQLEYKAKKFRCKIVITDRFYPSSKICCHGGHKKKSFVYPKELITVRTALFR